MKSYVTQVKRRNECASAVGGMIIAGKTLVKCGFQWPRLAGLVLIVVLQNIYVSATAQSQTAGADFYVSLNGRDTWSGVLPAPNEAGTDGPFATLERAKSAIRSLKQAGTIPASGATVWIRGGTYFRTATFELTSADSGTASGPIIYRNYTNETVRISGGKP
jgi:hypothetical protein